MQVMSNVRSLHGQYEQVTRHEAATIGGGADDVMLGIIARRTGVAPAK